MPRAPPTGDETGAHRDELTEESTAMSAAAAAHHEPCEHGADSDAVRVADMLDALAAGDVQLTINGLEDLLGRLRTAAVARQLLADVDRDRLKAALVLRRQRAEDGRPG
jgi:hypothetical protein